MSTQSKTKANKGKKSKPAASIVWFQIPADNLARAKKFYSRLFGWRIKPSPGMGDFQYIDTGGADASPDGGLVPRKHAGHDMLTTTILRHRRTC
jgi:uncharacterized protein